jgi:hypothetical protein
MYATRCFLCLEGWNPTDDISATARRILLYFRDRKLKVL